MRHSDMVQRGDSVAKYHKFYLSDPNRITDYSLSSFDKYLGAINRAVRKYGSYDDAKRAYLNETRREYIEISKFCSWAPTGQRAKNVPKKDGKQKLYETVSLNRAEANKRLASLPKSMRDEIILLLGIK